MSFVFDFRLDTHGLEHVHFVLTRPKLTSNGDIESAFLDTAIGIDRHPAGRPLAEALLNAATNPDTDILAIIRNPDLVVDEHLHQRIRAAVQSLATSPAWAVAGAGGLGLADRRHLALYPAADPLIPLPGGPLPLIDVMPDLYLVNAAFARHTLASGAIPSDAALETVLTVEGYLAGRVSFFLPDLSAGINGPLLARDLTLLTEAIQDRFSSRLAGQVIHSLSGAIKVQPSSTSRATASSLDATDLDACIAEQIRASSDPASLTIVTRTRFDRPHLLNRLLTSISRARRDNFSLEIVLSSDAPADKAHTALAQLQTAFPTLNLRLQNHAPGAHSRVTNLVEGIGAADHDYVLIVDDDDYLDLFAFDTLLPAFFSNNRPLIIASSEVHNEVWQETGSGRAFLTQSEAIRIYDAAGWKTMFDGVNSLPICACAIPRDFLVRRLAAIDFTHDLSEDYALFLLLLTAPDLPEIYETQAVLCHISIRGEGNSVTMQDRRPWARDIAGHIARLTTSRAVAGPGVWTVLGNASDRGAPAVSASIEDLRHGLDRREAQLRSLTRENLRLKEQLATLGGCTP